ncbi:MAG: hypothetical protein WCA96_06090 [Methylocella sp.]
MGILVVGGILFGMILGRFFKWFVLIPACGLAAVFVLINPAHMENSLLSWFFQFVALTASLQIGYVVGLVAPNFRRASRPLKNLGVRRLDETLSSGSKTRHRGRRAA